jgi:hypothetical protein
MSNARNISNLKRSRTFNNLLLWGLEFVSSDTQLKNGTLAFKDTIRDTVFKVTTNGAGAGIVYKDRNIVVRICDQSTSKVYGTGLKVIERLLT